MADPFLALIPPLSDQNCPDKLLIQSLSDKLNVNNPRVNSASFISKNEAAPVQPGSLIF